METFKTLGDMLLRRYVTDFVGQMQGMFVKRLSKDVTYTRLWDEKGKESLEFQHLCIPLDENKISFNTKKDAIKFCEEQNGKCPNCNKEFLPYKKMEFAAKLREFKK
jgi:hypothetical protein